MNTKKMSDYKTDQNSLHLQFVAMLLHDLESPLAVTKQFLHRVEEGRHDPANPRHQDLVTATRLAVNRAERILEDVLDLARAHEEGLKIHFQPTNLRECIQQCKEMVVHLAEDKNLELQLNVDSSLPEESRIDASLFERVIDNFLINAIRNAPRNTSVQIGVSCNEISYRIEVENQLAEEVDVDFEKIFEPDYQVEIRSKKQLRGSGLGLTFCKEAVTAMKGYIGAKRKQDGNVVFWIELPRE